MSSTAHSHFQAWGQAGVFARLWDETLHDYQDLIGLDFDWLALDGSRHKALLGGKKNRPQSTDHGKGGVKRSLPTEAPGIPVGLVLDGANRHDMKRAESTLASLPPAAAEAARQAHRASGAGQGLCLDADFDYAQVREVVASFGYLAMFHFACARITWYNCLFG